MLDYYNPLERVNYFLKGTTDVVIIELHYARSHNVADGIQVTIDLKKVIKKNDMMQVVLQLLAVNDVPNYHVVALVTDLREEFTIL